MNFLLDTNIISETTRPRANPAVLDWIAAQDAAALFLSALTIGELQRGVWLLPEGKKRQQLQRWIETGIKAGFAERILPLDTAVMESWAQIQVTAERAGRRAPLMDSLIAATALTHGLTLATRNIADFETTGVLLFDPWG